LQGIKLANAERPAMATHSEIFDLVNATPFVDTHEHLWEERTRLAALAEPDKHPIPNDLGILFYHYADSDLVSAGLSPDDRKKMVDPMTDVKDKWRLIGPIYARTRHTGYLQNVRESLRLMFGEEDITDDNYQRISDQIRDQIAPGYFNRLLRDVSKIEHAQVNSFEDPVFNETQYPDLLCQDLSFVGLSTALNIEPYAKKANREVGSLDDWHGIIDWVFETYGPRAIAIKNQSAYGRRLDYDNVDAKDAAPLFARHIREPKGSAEFEKKAIQDHLFHYCIRKSVEYNLPVKLHTGYYAGTGGMPLHRVSANDSDLCPVLKAHPDAKFIIMHISYPYQDEAIVLAKHYPNVFVDMCWAWIINPLASVRFTKEYLMAAPHTKLLTFGGDYLPVEMVPGHAAIARKGLAQAISELLSDGWVKDSEVPELVDRIMRGNAHEVFDYDGTLSAWNMPAA
jgi:hypothetical protein